MESREPALRLLGEDHRVRRRLGLALATGLVLLTGCGGGSSAPPTGSPAGSPTGSPTGSPASPGSPTASPTQTETQAAPPPPPPKNGACYNVTFTQALAPTMQAPPVSCRHVHTTETYAVGRLQTVIHGHHLAIDSPRVRAQPAAHCPEQLPRFLGGSLADVRLSMLRPVWFTPTLEESDSGASWYRCDAIAVAGPNHLVRLTASLKGILGREATASDFAMCGTAEPGTHGFSRVPCRAHHSWRAIDVVPLSSGPYPGVATVRDAGQEPCKAAGRNVAQDALNYQWGYEWPTKAEWAAGQTYGICWAPG